VTAVSLPDTPRRPDGVVLEPSPAMPAVEDTSSGASSVVALREPLGGDAAVSLVRSLVRAFEHEDIEALQGLLTDDAVPIGGGRPSRGALVDQWRTRLKNLDYGRLKGTEVVRLDRIERFAFPDLDPKAGAGARPSEMKPGDLLLRVPVAAPRVGSEQLFGDVLVLVVRREGREYRIAAFGEENGP
jgi:hypothetical protein